MKLRTIPKIQRRKADIEGVQHREAELDYRKADPETRTVPATLSSELPVKRWFGNEILRHDEESVDLGRASDGLPLLFNHDSNAFIGAVRNVRVEGGKLRGDMVFSKNQRADEVFQDVTAGLLRNVSIGYRIDEMEERDNGDVIATRWALAEASIAPVPADPSVGVNRKEEVPTMDRKQIADDVRKEELDRIAAVRSVFNVKWKLEEKHVQLRERMIEEGATADEARAEFMDLLDIANTPIGGANPEVEAARTGGNDQLATMMTQAIQARAGTLKPEEAERVRGNNEFTGMTLVEMTRAWLRISGLDHTGDPLTIVGRAFTQRALQETSDFPSILMDAAHNALLMAYWDAPETWDQWARTGNLADFKINNRSNLSEFEDLDLIPEGGTYAEADLSDLHETIQLATYGKNWKITRQALINDSLSAFSRVPTAMGLSAARKVGDLAYAVLTSNPNLNQDGFPVFDNTNHGNDGTASAITADAVTAGKVAMALQKGPKNVASLGIPPAILLTSIAKESEARALMQAEYDPATTAGTLYPNTVRGLMTVASDHRLDEDNPLTWYMLAAPSRWDTVEVAFLNGNRSPFQERRQQDISNDDITYKVRIDAAAAPLDFRGMYRNAGA